MTESISTITLEALYDITIPQMDTKITRLMVTAGGAILWDQWETNALPVAQIVGISSVRTF